MELPFLFSAIFFLGFFLSLGNSIFLDDKQALLDFINKFPHSRYLNWDQSTSVCDNWTGITCSSDGSRVIAVRLPGVGFSGEFPANTLTRLSELQILSLRSNGISGSFPSDLYNLKNLSLLYLQFNNFSGPLPENFSVWKNLTVLNLSNNNFMGIIPFSISNLTHIQALNLANNSLSGQIPDLYMPTLQQLNLSNNNLTGIVPKSLEKFPKSGFWGNNVSFLNSTNSGSPVSWPINQPIAKSKNARKLREKGLMGIIIAGSVFGFGFLLLICFLRKRSEDGFSGKLAKGELSPEKAIARNQDASNKLVFFEGCNYAFDLEDLLRASAEVLGKGTFGMAYKAVLEDVTTVVVKRLKDVSVGRREFEQQMGVIGSIKHENVIEIRAYYYSKDEKLMVYDYFSHGSVAALLHGNRGEDRTPLDWETRLRIAIGAARGIARIHEENSGKFVHGNVKSSNIFLNSRNYGCVSDVGLSSIMSSLAPPIARAAGYRAPEMTDTRKSSQYSDVYSFGILILELLTGKSPVYTTGGDEVIHLVQWVHSVVREEWTGEVFDMELMKYPNIEEEMVEMLQIGMACVVRTPDQRPKMVDVVRMIESVRPSDFGNRPNLEAKLEDSTPMPRVFGTESSFPR